MDAIYIPQIAQATDRKQTVIFEEFITDLETLTPVKGTMELRHQHSYLEVTAQAETIVTLTCDRCLQHYNYRLRITPSEMLWLKPDADPDRFPEGELDDEALVESLPLHGHFHGDTWLYEQLCLALPQRQICSEQCRGIPLTDQSESNAQGESARVDRRWAALANLKSQLNA